MEYEPVLTQLPEGYIPREQWPEYDLPSEAPKFLGPRLVGKKPKGMYRRLWPIVVEEYISDEEPVLEDSDPQGIALNRVLIWQRITRTDTPQKWWATSKEVKRLEGFAEIKEKEYWKQWSESARRYRRKWLGEHFNITYTLEQISYEEFEAAYKKSSVWKVVKTILLDVIKRKLCSPAASHVELWGARSIKTGRIVAGMATLTSPSCRGSYYISGFIMPEGENDPVMVGLMDNWFSRSHSRNIIFLHFGGFWIPGNPENWKGFSIFKQKFGLSYLAYPAPVFRFKKGRLFNF